MAAILAPADRAGQLDGAGIEQQLLRESRLAGIRVGNDRKGPPPRDLTFELGGYRIDLVR